MALGSDPYEVLGVPRDASDDQIARARRRLSRAYHPDVNPAPDAAARFDEVQQAYRRLSGASPENARARDEPRGDEPRGDEPRGDEPRGDRPRGDRPRGDRPRGDRQGQARAARDPGDGSVTEAAPGVFVQPASVDFGRLTPEQPRADVKVTIAWTGASPGRMESTRGSEWWANLGSEQPATSCVVFYLRAHGHAGTRGGRQHDQFTVLLDDTVLTVPLTAEIRGEFPPGSRPDFTPRPQPDLEWHGLALPGHLRIWLMVVILALVFLAYLVLTTR